MMVILIFNVYFNFIIIIIIIMLIINFIIIIIIHFKYQDYSKEIMIHQLFFHLQYVIINQNFLDLDL